MAEAVLRDGSTLAIRPLESADRVRIRRLFYRLSPESVYRRFLGPIQEPSEQGLDRLLDLDHRDRDALAAMSGEEIVGVARYFREPGSSTAEIAVLVEDAWQGRGLSLLLIERLAGIARARGINWLTALMMGQNRPAIAMVRRAFPGATFSQDGPEITAAMELDR